MSAKNSHDVALSYKTLKKNQLFVLIVASTSSLSILFFNSSSHSVFFLLFNNFFLVCSFLRSPAICSCVLLWLHFNGLA